VNAYGTAGAVGITHWQEQEPSFHVLLISTVSMNHVSLLTLFTYLLKQLQFDIFKLTFFASHYEALSWNKPKILTHKHADQVSVGGEGWTACWGTVCTEFVSTTVKRMRREVRGQRA
jgi:hypothetical protein